MRYTCEGCSTQYEIADERIGPDGARVRCFRCDRVTPIAAGGEIATSPEALPATVEELLTAASDVVEGAQAEADVTGGVAGPVAEPPAAEDELGSELGAAFDKVMMAGPPIDLRQTSATEAARTAEPREPAPSATPEPKGAPVEPARVEWWVAIDEKQVGPMSREGVRARWESGEVGPDTLVWFEGMDGWAALSSVAELSAYLAPFARQARPAAPEAAPVPARTPAAPARPAPSAPTPVAPVRTPAETTWRPSAASALADLAAAEIAAKAAAAAAAAPKPTPPAPAAPVAAEPEKGLVASMGLPRAPQARPAEAAPPAPGAFEEPAARKGARPAGVEIRPPGARRNTAVIAAAAIAAVAVVGVGLWWTMGRKGEERPPVAAVKPPAPAPAVPAATPPGEPSAPAAQPAPAPTAAAVPAAPAAAAPAPAATPVSPAAPTAALPAPAVAARPAPSAAAPAPSSAVPAAKPAAPVAPPAVAAPARKPAAPPPAAPPARGAGTPEEAAARPEAAATPAPAAKKTGDPLLDSADVDAAFEKELGQKPKRSVYVPPAAGTDLPEKLSEAQIQEGVATRIDALRKCLEEQSSSRPDSHGTLRMRWTIQPDGAVSGVKSLTPDLAGQPITTCISGVISSIRFPRTRNGVPEVVFPFKF